MSHTCLQQEKMGVELQRESSDTLEPTAVVWCKTRQDTFIHALLAYQSFISYLKLTSRTAGAHKVGKRQQKKLSESKTSESPH